MLSSRSATSPIPGTSSGESTLDHPHRAGASRYPSLQCETNQATADDADPQLEGTEIATTLSANADPQSALVLQLRERFRVQHSVGCTWEMKGGDAPDG